MGGKQKVTDWFWKYWVRLWCSTQRQITTPWRTSVINEYGAEMRLSSAEVSRTLFDIAKDIFWYFLRNAPRWHHWFEPRSMRWKASGPLKQQLKTIHMAAMRYCWVQEVIFLRSMLAVIQSGSKSLKQFTASLEFFIYQQPEKVCEYIVFSKETGI